MSTPTNAPIADATADDERVLFKPDLAKRYNKARETIWRWQVSGKLPPPDVRVAGHEGWYQRTIRAHESAA
jgi:hypothetical protein